jgi:hypothetical protein
MAPHHGNHGQLGLTDADGHSADLSGERRP